MSESKVVERVGPALRPRDDVVERDVERIVAVLDRAVERQIAERAVIPVARENARDHTTSFTASVVASPLHAVTLHVACAPAGSVSAFWTVPVTVSFVRGSYVVTTSPG